VNKFSLTILFKKIQTDGQTIIPIGPSPLTNGSLHSSSRENITNGSEKARVLPDPVNAIPIISLPANLQKKSKKVNLLPQ
jgi:hypothetical protein